MVLLEGNEKNSTVVFSSKVKDKFTTDLITLLALKKSSPGRIWLSERGTFGAGHSVERQVTRNGIFI